MELSRLELLFLRKQVVVSIENAERRLTKYRRLPGDDDIFGERKAIAESEFFVMSSLLSRINDEIARIALDAGC